MFEDNHENIKLNALAFMTSDILIQCFRNNPGAEAMEVAEKMNTIMANPALENDSLSVKEKDEIMRNRPQLIIIVNKCDSVKAYNNPLDIFDLVVKQDPQKTDKVKSFKNKFIEVKCIGIAGKHDRNRGGL